MAACSVPPTDYWPVSDPSVSSTRRSPRQLIAGLSVGLAAQGFRPVAEIQFMGFVYATIDQLLNHAARLRNRHAAGASPVRW